MDEHLSKPIVIDEAIKSNFEMCSFLTRNSKILIMEEVLVVVVK